ncbi:MAG: 16S rRNA (guanine(527)-N(7))-methyltransferase RsmG [Petrimonas sp.]|uniref:16S rRNA (guanine(527)-N(7))-methyltransferase RsmG n=1 Tax=Petrimonas sp. TaxID=2023866 RepID=UPI002B3B32C2|nr:16S rRNA (guanine(527)-N(7))-methyltransferase RsmG [Petrimonas sp.]MEA5044930.1 16S rRNA (guanine(527)-N(7))-methyltransferase RsmG [Petrimonas sp.]
MSIIDKYFPSLSAKQKEQIDALFDLYSDWNSRINVISRKDIDNLYLHHVLHSLAIAKYIRFQPGTSIIDVGTGGGFPGIPLALFFPEVNFLLLDSIGKKIKVAREVSQAIGLQNVDFIHSRMEDEKRKFDFVVSRAVMPLPDLVRVVRKNISSEQKNALPNGIICLKGGDLAPELSPFKGKVEVFSLDKYFSESFFETKKLIYLPV